MQRYDIFTNPNSAWVAPSPIGEYYLRSDVIADKKKDRDDIIKLLDEGIEYYDVHNDLESAANEIIDILKSLKDKIQA